VQTLGAKDIDIDGWPTFSKRYQLRGPDTPAILRLFTPPVLQFCEQTRGLWISGVGSHLWFHREAVRAKPETLSAFIEAARQTAALFAAANSGSGGAVPPPPLPPPPQ
jgi:hypothetical protein